MYAPPAMSGPLASQGTEAAHRVGALGRRLHDRGPIIAALDGDEWREWFRRESFVESADPASRLLSTTMDGTG